MREDAGAQAAAIECEQAEDHAEDGKQDHVARALIAMRAAEDDGGGEDANSYRSARPADELALQIAAKDGLLDKTDEQAKHGPGDNLSSVGGRELGNLAQHFELRGGGGERDLLILSSLPGGVSGRRPVRERGLHTRPGNAQ